MHQFLTTFVGTTAFKYLVAMLATYLAQKFGLDPAQGQFAIEGVLTQFVGVLMAAWGVWESTRSKITLEGQVITRGKEEVAQVIEAATPVSGGFTKPNGDVLVGKAK